MNLIRLATRAVFALLALTLFIANQVFAQSTVAPPAPAPAPLPDPATDPS